MHRLADVRLPRVIGGGPQQFQPRGVLLAQPRFDVGNGQVFKGHLVSLA